MDVKLLDADEFEVECMVRELQGTPTEKLLTLLAMIREENTNPVVKPHRMHKAATRQPHRELQKCRNKLTELKEWVSGINQKDILSNEELQRTESRLLHLNNRLTRLTRSKTYKSEALEAIQLCTEVLLVVQSLMQGDGNLDETLNKIRMTTSYEVMELSDTDEEFSNEDKKEEMIPKAAISNTHNNEENINEVLPPTSHSSSPTVPRSIRQTTAKGKGCAAEVNHPPATQQAFEEELQPRLAEVTTARSVNFNEVLNSGKTPLGTFLPTQPGIPLAEHRSYSHHQPNEFQYNRPSEPLSKHPFPSYFGNYRTVSDHRGLSRCDLSFDGSPGGLSIERFLFRVERTAYNIGLPDHVLVDEVQYVLKGAAKEWYWFHLELNPVITWSQLRIDLISRFQDRRSDYEIRRLVEARRQQRKESFLDFYNHILALTLQSRHLFPEIEILHILRRNMRPGLQIALADRLFHSTNELLSSCISLEDTWVRLNYDPDILCQPRRFVNEVVSDPNYSISAVSPPIASIPPPKNYVSSFAGELKYNHDHSRPPQYQNNISILKPEHSQSPTSQSSPIQYQFSTEHAVCWNCFDLGHYFKNCPKTPQHLFCYGCGCRNVIKPRCLKCNSKTGNRSEERQRSGVISPVQVMNPSRSKVDNHNHLTN